MINNFDLNHSGRSRRAYEIELHVREMEKKYALMNAMNRANATTDFLAGFKRTSRQVGS